MKRNLRRTLSLLLVLALCLSLIPVQASAGGTAEKTAAATTASEEATEATEESTATVLPVSADRESAQEETADDAAADSAGTEAVAPVADTADDDGVTASGTCGDNLTWTLTDDGTLTISGTGDMTDYSYDNQAPWYTRRDSIVEVVLESGVASIGNYAFFECICLPGITIPDGVTSIGMFAFAYCKSLTSVTIPDSVSDIRYAAFCECSSLTSAVIGNGVVTIGDFVFNNCTSLTCVTIGDSVTSIGEYAFQECTSLTSIAIPDSVTNLDPLAFYLCYSLSTITVSAANPVYTVSDGILYSRNMTSLFFCPADNAITDYTIPDGVTNIGDRAFSSCFHLTSVTIPESVTNIGYRAFYYCPNLTAIAVSAANQAYTSSDGILYTKDMTELICCPAGSTLTDYTMPDGVTSIDGFAFAHCDIDSISISDSVTSIGEHSFYNCGLSTIAIGSGVNTIGEAALSGCYNLATITVSSANQRYTASDGVLYTKDMAELLCFPAGSAQTEYTIPDGVISIGGYAFFYCRSLTSVTIPDSVTSIGKYAFRRCTNLTSITIPDSVTSIDGAAFANCTSLKKIIFLGDAPDMETDLFADVTATAYYPADNDTWTKDVMQYYGGTITWDWYESLEELEDGYLPSGVCGDNLTWKLHTSGTLAIHGSGAMYSWEDGEAPWYEYRDDITYVWISDDATSIGAYAFSGCSNLRTITIGSSMASIEDYAFYNCSSLKSVTLTETLESLGVGAFAGCTSLTKLTFEGDAPSFGENVFLHVTATAYYDSITGNWPEDVMQDYGGTITWKSIYYDCDPVLQQSGTFSFYSDDLEDSNGYCEYTYDYDESWFFNSSKTYQHELTQMSIRVAMAAYGKNNDDSMLNSANITLLMNELNFENLEVSYPKPDTNTIGYAIGSKNIVTDTGETCSLVMVAVRGGGYYGEWGGNFYLGDSGDHEGFSYAAVTVLAALIDYVEKYDDQLPYNLKVWITGYSRAAAVTNLVAAQLDSPTYAIGGIDRLDRTDLFAFCFECPQCTTDSMASSVSKYGNIVNIVNPSDLVTKVAPSADGWDFTRYGVTYYLPDSSNSSGYYSLYKGMVDEYAMLAVYNDAYFALEAVTYSLGQASIFDNFIDLFASTVGDRTTYRSNYESGVMAVLTDFNSDTSKANSVTKTMVLELIGKCVPELLVFHLVNCELFATTMAISGVRTHYAEQCLAWLDSLDGNTLCNQSTGYRRVFVNCPVDVTVYNEDGEVVAQIIEDEVQDIENGLGAYLDENGQKVIILPMDAQYTVELSATDDGEMTYTVTEYDWENNGTDRVVSYYEVAIESGDVLTGIVEDLQEVDQAEYPLYDTEENQITASVDEDGDISTWYVTVSDVGLGAVVGGGSYVSGEFAAVTATPCDGAEFLGWYIGDELVSQELEYRFLVTEDVSITARFTEATLSGTVTSYGDADETVTITLFADGVEEAIDQVVVTGDEAYCFTGLSDGTYTLQVEKSCHVTRTYEIAIEDAACTLDVEIRLLGDVNGDGEVTARDATEAYSYATNSSELDEYATACADADGSGDITTRDATQIYAHAEGGASLW